MLDSMNCQIDKVFAEVSRISGYSLSLIKAVEPERVSVPPLEMFFTWSCDLAELQLGVSIR